MKQAVGLTILGTLLFFGSLIAVAYGQASNPGIRPFAEGTANCNKVVYWFAEGYLRTTSTPWLTLFNGMPEAQDVNVVAVLRNGSTRTATYNLGPRSYFQTNLSSLFEGSYADFSLEVTFGSYGAAELKMWNATSVLPSQGLVLCK